MADIFLINLRQDNPNDTVGDGVVQDTSGDVIFKVSFRAISCIPEAGEVLDGEVIEVTMHGVNVRSGPVVSFISMAVSDKTTINSTLESTK